MKAWLCSSLAALIVAAAAAGTAAAQSNAERANQLNDEGKEAMKRSDFTLASERFQQAIVLSKEGRFYFNLCVSWFRDGKFGDALSACKAVETAGADAKLKEKTATLTAQIKDEMRKQGMDPDAVVVNPNPEQPQPNPPNPDPGQPNPPNPDPGQPNPPNPNPPNPGQQQFQGARPDAALFAATAVPEHKYTWTLGFELLAGSGKWGVQEEYSNPSFGFRFLGDYLLSPTRKFGLQASIGLLHANETSRRGIDVIDIGLAGYKHFCFGRTCITPLVGPSIGLLQPADLSGSDAMPAIGIRAEARVGFALGRRFEHLLSVTAGFQGYTRAFDSGDLDAEFEGLDEPSAVALLAFGYTYRFNTPLGSSPMWTLE